MPFGKLKNLCRIVKLNIACCVVADVNVVAANICFINGAPHAAIPMADIQSGRIVVG